MTVIGRRSNGATPAPLSITRVGQSHPASPGRDRRLPRRMFWQKFWAKVASSWFKLPKMAQDAASLVQVASIQAEHSLKMLLHSSNLKAQTLQKY
eukprot:12427274-Karenia_brevis.AAC.1